MYNTEYIGFHRNFRKRKVQGQKREGGFLMPKDKQRLLGLPLFFHPHAWLCNPQRAPGLHIDRLLARCPVSVCILSSYLHDVLTSCSQVLENLRRQSCEGLALPFLANWFLGAFVAPRVTPWALSVFAGDFSNLIGCILTDQLPFQVRIPSIPYRFLI